MRGQGGKKVPALSYGSNDLANLVLACKRCNAFKKHLMPSKELISRIL
jgi:5-methylcytosine-specific restriction endonuclease McrA